MNQENRLDLILSELEVKQSLSVRDIIKLTGSSRDTARRDILKLAEKEVVERNYGGISLPNTMNKLDEFLDRVNDFPEEKKGLARASSQLIQKSEFIYLDVSTTIMLMPHYLSNHSNIFTVTNSIDIADQLLRNSDVRVRMIGGTLDKEKRCVIDTKALSELDSYQFDQAFLSVAGINSRGIYYAYEEDIELKKKIRQQANKIILLIDQEKVNVTHNFKVFDFEEIDTIISTYPFPSKLHELLIAKGVELIYTKPYGDKSRSYYRES